MTSPRSLNVLMQGFEVVIIGSGAAGLSAAVAASEGGAKVILFEKRKVIGGRSVRAEGFFAAESPAQKRMGGEAPKDVLFKMAMEYAHWEINPRIIRTFINKSGDTVQWLEGMGLKIDRISPFYRGQPIKTWHQPEKGGAAIIEVLLKKFIDTGGQFVTGSTVKKILTESSGKLTGVLAIIDGYEHHVKTNAVIIATGGYGGDKKLLKEYCPFYSEEMGTSDPVYAGEGLAMAFELGAGTEGLGGLHISGPRFDGAAKNVAVIAQEPLTLWVNKKGDRFTDESTAFNHYESVNAILQQPGKISFSIFDKNILETIIKNGPIKLRDGVFYGVTKEDLFDAEKQLKRQAEAGSVIISDSWSELAQWIGAEPEHFINTIKKYNECAQCGYDESFLKNTEYLIPLNTPPFYAMKCRTGIIGTIGGIKVSHRMEVLNRADDPIAGLYAAGTDVGGWEPRTYNVHLSGSTLGFPLNSGRIAGEEAARFIARNSNAGKNSVELS